MIVSIKNRLINKDYIFIYQDAKYKWNTCINPEFIARHQMCRAIPVEQLNKYFKSIDSLLLLLNRNDIKRLNENRELFYKNYIL